MSRILLERYELGDVIGAGGMAKVHLATDRVLDRRVAVKVLDDMAARSADPAARDRFLNEARSAAAFTHPNAVGVFDAGEDDGVLFIVMELIDGESLAARMARPGGVDVADAVRIASEVLDALDAMHRIGVVHRDVKPANIMLNRHGQVKLTDFGIAKRLDEIDEALTAAGTVIGTPHYLAPEQAVGGTLGPRTDVYLVGAVLYEMLTAHRPPSVLHGPPTRSPDPRQHRPDLPVALADAVVRGLAHRESDRFATAAAMAAALRHVSLDIGQRGPPAPGSSQPPTPPTAAATAEFPVAPEDAQPADDGEPTDEIGAISDEAVPPTEIAPSDEMPDSGSPATNTTVDGPAPRWLRIAAIVVALLLVIGITITAIDRATNDETPTVQPADGEQFLAALRDDPGRFGARGDDLLVELEAVLAETDGSRRADAIEALKVDIFVWAAEGELDTAVGALVDDLLAG